MDNASAGLSEGIDSYYLIDSKRMFCPSIFSLFY